MEDHPYHFFSPDELDQLERIEEAGRDQRVSKQLDPEAVLPGRPDGLQRLLGLLQRPVRSPDPPPAPPCFSCIIPRSVI